MKNWDDLVKTARNEAEKWFVDQIQNEWTDYYWRYVATTEKAPGRIYITAESSSDPIACRLRKDLTTEQNLGHFLHFHAHRLPVLEID